MAKEAWQGYRMLPRKTWSRTILGWSRDLGSVFDGSQLLVFGRFRRLFFLPKGLGVSDLWADDDNSPGYRQFLVSESFRRCQIWRRQMEKSHFPPPRVHWKFCFQDFLAFVAKVSFWWNRCHRHSVSGQMFLWREVPLQVYPPRKGFSQLHF